MGTAILANLLGMHLGHLGVGRALALALLVLAWILLVVLMSWFAVTCLRSPGTWRESWQYPFRAPLWGMASMGFLATGAATASVIPLTRPDLHHLAWSTDLLLWLIGTSLGLATAFGFLHAVSRDSIGEPSFVRGLAVVPPMVSATTGAALVPHAPEGAARWVFLVFTLGCFAVALACGVVVFGVAYRHFWSGNPVPLPMRASTWIPLGMVGQSTAAAQTLDDAVRSVTNWSVDDPAARLAGTIAHGYGAVVLTVGVPLFGWALWTTSRALASRMPFSPGWWAMTFPVGTCCLGSTLLGRSLGYGWLETVGAVLLALLACNWALCAVVSVKSIAVSARHAAAG